MKRDPFKLFSSDFSRT